jgi:tetratricopeptide (TPR) repeat protein
MVLLDSLNQQAELLLLAGQPHPVEEIIERMNSIDPEYEHIKELRSETDELLQFESDYKEALNLVAEDRDAEGLDILKKLNNEKPGMWDIDFQISSIEDSIQLAESLEKGNSAYQVEQWDQVINAYENALTLDPEYNDPLMKEQLLNAYLQSIIGMLENEYTTTENLENAERYYRSAVAMIPQNKAFSSERGNLEEVSSNLLELQFTQNAKAILEDKNQTTAAISKAVSYLSKAATIKPANAVLQLDLKNARFYQTGFENFIGMDWESAIANLNQIVSVDPDYAGGNARVLLYEAYYALGKHFNSLSLYQDARENLEQAEILAWDDSDNLLKLFQVQVLLGDTIGKMNDFQNAVSYYKYALEVIELPQKLSQYPTINTMYKEADNLLVLGEFEKAFTAFRGVIDGIDPLYTNSEIEIKDGVCLAFFASENISTVNAVIDANNLPNTMVIAFGRKLIVPFIEK